MRSALHITLWAMAASLCGGCGASPERKERTAQGLSPAFDAAWSARTRARLRDAFVRHDSAFCDSVLPFFDDTALARIHPERVTDAFVSHLIIHEVPDTSIRTRFDRLVVHSGAPVMRNWRDYVDARTIQDTGSPQRAIAVFEPLLERFQQDHDTVGIASVSKRIGYLYHDLGEPAIATRYLLRARALEPRVDLRCSITATLGRCYASMGNADSVRWCVDLLDTEGASALHRERGDRRAVIDARWLSHLAHLLEPGEQHARAALAEGPSVDSAITAHADGPGYLEASGPAARVETSVARARALLHLGRSREALALLRSVEKELSDRAECLPQQLIHASALSDAWAACGDLKAALVTQQRRAELLATNEVGRERLAVERAHARTELERMEADADRSLEQERSKARSRDIEHRMQRIVLVVMIGFVILFAGVLFAHARIRRHMQLEQLRTRLSRDLHDDIGSTLSSINILSAVARRKAEAGDETGAAASLSGISERTQRLMRNMSDIVWSVDPDKDTMEELLVRMREFGAAVLEPKGITYRFDNTGELNVAMPPMLKSNLYLIFKEAVNNAAKHAQATEVIASFTHENDRLRMTIADNGKGLNTSGAPSTSMGGNGLRNMRARSVEMKADLCITGTRGSGTTIDLMVPL